MRDLTDFVIESNLIEGIDRPALPTEIEAYKEFLGLAKITVADLEAFVDVIQPGAKLRREVGMDVGVGDYIPPTPLNLRQLTQPRGGAMIESELLIILGRIDGSSLTPYEAHIRYERLHPFLDGNGRSGRVLWLWMMGGKSPLGFLHSFYYQTLSAAR